MGLEILDMMFQLERRFGISLDAKRFSRATTVADVAGMVIEKLPREEEGRCAKARAFFGLRGCLIEGANYERRSVRPSTRLDELLPPNRRWRARRRVWSLLVEHDRRVPPLELSAIAERLALRLVAVLVFLMLMAAAVVWAERGAWTGVLGAVVGLVIVSAGYVLVTMPMRTAVPAGLDTVGDLARLIAPIEIPSTGIGRRLVVEQRVVEGVRAVVADAAYLPIEKVKPDSILVSDLGMS